MRQPAQGVGRAAAKAWKFKAPAYRPGNLDAFQPATPLPDSLDSALPKAQTRDYPETWKAPSVEPQDSPTAPALKGLQDSLASPRATNDSTSGQMMPLLESIKAQQEQQASYASLVKTIENSNASTAEKYQNLIAATLSYHNDSQDLMKKHHLESLKATSESQDAIISAIADLGNKSLRAGPARSDYDTLKVNTLSAREVEAFLSRKLDKNPRILGQRLAKEELSYYKVIVDGDAMPFHPSYVQQGFNGGRALIRQFKNRVRAYVEELIPMNRTMRRRSQINDLDIIIRVYSNVQDLGKVYCENEHISSESVFHDFIRGFNTSASCDFTDAGAGLDKADRKVIYQFRDAFLDFHCHHVLFCGASDTGYFDMLRKAKNQTSRLTLVEAVPFPALIQPFKEVFDIAQFPDIFLSKPLDHKRLPTLDRSYLKYEPHAVDGSTPETPPRPGSSEDRLAAIESSLAEMINLLQEPRSHTHQSAGHLSTINPDPLADFARPSGNLDEGLHYQSSSHREPVGDIYSADIRDEHGQGIKMETDTPRESEPAPSPGNSSEDPESQTPIDPQESTNEAAQPEHADADADADGQTDPLQKLADKRELLLKYIDRLNASLLKIVEFHGDENEYLHSQARRRLGDNRDWKRLSAKFKTLSNDPVLAEMNLCRTAGLIHVRLENLISTLKDANEEIYDQFIRSNHAIQVTTSQLRDFATTYRRSSWHAFNKQASKAIRKTRHG